MEAADGPFVDLDAIAGVVEWLRTAPKRGPLRKRETLVARRQRPGAATSAAGAAAGDADDGTPDYSYSEMLRFVYESMHAAKIDVLRSTKHRLPVPVRCKVGGARTAWCNFRVTCQALKRDPDHVQLFFSTEMCITAIQAPDKGWLVASRNRLDPMMLEQGLNKYVTTYVECGGCRSWETVLAKDPVGRMWKVTCASCHAARAVPHLKAGFRATTRSDRRDAKSTEDGAK
jgi:translation initiation factor 2 beta subunit (eIF-2beta)/eIF-5